MAKRKTEKTEDYPALGRWLMFLEKPKAVEYIVYGLYILCALLIALDFFYTKKVYFDTERYWGFYGLYGFFMCAGLVICSKMMRVFLKRDEDFYAPTDTQSEDHPDHDLMKESVHD